MEVNNKETIVNKEANEHIEREKKTPVENKTFTQEDIDKIVSKTIAKERKRAEEEAAMAKMSESEKIEAINKKKAAELEAELNKYKQKDVENEVLKNLSANSLPIEFSNFLIAKDSESSLTNVNSFKEVWESKIEAEVEKRLNERLKGSTPKAPNASKATSFTLDEVRKMTPQEINKNWDKIKHLKFN